MKRIIISFFTIIVVTLVLWVAGFFYYIHYTNSYVVNNVATDAIAVFTGGKQRISTGVQLLKAGYAPVLFISGVESLAQLKQFLIENSVNTDHVIYGLNASSTKDNAKEVADFISSHSVRSIRLVTSSYHMPRALEETRQQAPYGTVIVPHPVFSNQPNYLVFFKEYHKYMFIIIAKFFS